MAYQRKRPIQPLDPAVLDAFEKAQNERRLVVTDNAFFQAIMMALQALPGEEAFRGEELRRATLNGPLKPLVLRLLSDEPLPNDSGTVLADLIAGKLVPPRGRPSKNALPPADDFPAMVLSAAKAFSRRGQKIRNASKGPTAKLISLLSEKVPDRDARFHLAEFLSGEWHREGAPGHTAEKSRAIRELVFDALDRDATMRASGMSASQAEDAAAMEFTKDPRIAFVTKSNPKGKDMTAVSSLIRLMRERAFKAAWRVVRSAERAIRERDSQRR